MARRCAWLGLVVCVLGALAPTAAAQQTAGVAVDAQGVLRLQSFADPDGRLTRQRIDAQLAQLAPDLARESPLRKISLNRLERAIEARLDAGQPLTDDMLNLAGLTRLQYVFFYPESGDIVIAGPAEPWAADLAGRVRGARSGRPIVRLEDLVVALRAFAPGGGNGGFVGCSIDPTQQGLARMQQFLREFGTRATPADTPAIVRALRESMGMQNISVLGVPPDTHFAQVMVEADYRMKLIGIGLERPPIKLTSYVERADPATVSRNALQRWYFVPDYECVRVSADGLAMRLEGEGVKLVGENELVDEAGRRVVQGAAGSRASQAFVREFTEKYAELAAASPVFAQLRNNIDLLVAAAFIQKQNYYGQARWYAATLLDEKKVPVQTLPAPKQVETAVNSLWKGNRLMTPVGGGVEIRAELALAPDNLLSDQRGQVRKVREEIDLRNLPEGRWWWD